MTPNHSASCDCLILAAGNFVWPSVTLGKKLTDEHNINTTVVNLRFIKPLDESLIPLIQQAKRVVVIEDGSQIGGVYHYILNQCKHLNNN